jgi:hypothetical protein
MKAAAAETMTAKAAILTDVNKAANHQAKAPVDSGPKLGHIGNHKKMPFGP